MGRLHCTENSRLFSRCENKWQIMNKSLCFLTWPTLRCRVTFGTLFPWCRPGPWRLTAAPCPPRSPGICLYTGAQTHTRDCTRNLQQGWESRAKKLLTMLALSFQVKVVVYTRKHFKRGHGHKSYNIYNPKQPITEQELKIQTQSAQKGLEMAF